MRRFTEDELWQLSQEGPVEDWLDEDDVAKFIDECCYMLHSGLYINANDTFAYACADCESFEVADLPVLAWLFREYGHAGITAWMAVKRGEDPIGPLDTDTYKTAKAWLLNEPTHERAK